MTRNDFIYSRKQMNKTFQHSIKKDLYNVCQSMNLALQTEVCLTFHGTI